jgi:hypothetical protein
MVDRLTHQKEEKQRRAGAEEEKEDDPGDMYSQMQAEDQHME